MVAEFEKNVNQYWLYFQEQLNILIKLFPCENNEFILCFYQNFFNRRTERAYLWQANFISLWIM